MISSSSAEKPFGCTWCPIRFTRKEHKARHEQSHSPQRVFPCSQCPRSFLRRDVLVRHEKSIHGISSSLKDSRRARRPLAANTSMDSTRSGVVSDDFSNLIETLDVHHAQMGHSSAEPESLIFTNSRNIFNADALSHVFIDPTLDLALSPSSLGATSTSSWVDIFQNPFAGGDAMALAVSDTQHTRNNSLDDSATELIEYIESSVQVQGPAVSPSLIGDTEINRLREVLQEPVLFGLGLVLSKLNMQRFLRGYFRFFHAHAPFIHIPTFQASTCSSPLLLSMCALGAIHTSDRSEAFKLYRSAKLAYEIQSTELPYNARLQALLLLAMFGSFAGEELLWNQSFSFQTQLAREFQLSPANLQSSTADSWESWIETEGLKRSLHITICYLGLMTASLFSTAVLLDFDCSIELTYEECFWAADNEEKWQLMMAHACVLPSFKSALQHLVFGGQSPTPQLSLLASNALMAAIFGYISRCKSTAFITPPNIANQLTACCSAALYRWLAALPSFQNYRSRLDANPSLEITSLLLWKVAFIQLHVDNASLESAKIAALRPEKVLQDDLYQRVPRGPKMTMSMRHALTWIRGPIGQGIQFLVKTGCLELNISYCLLGFHCVVLLIRWLYTLEVEMESGSEQPLTTEEQDVIDSIRANISESNLPFLNDLPLSKACAQVWVEVATSATITWDISGFLGNYLARFT